MNQNPLPPPHEPLYGLIKFLAIIGLLTIFFVGLRLGMFVATGG